MDNTELTDFARLVRDMREAQNMYFKHRDSTILKNAKNLESQVDKQVIRLVGKKVVPGSNQTSLL